MTDQQQRFEERKKGDDMTCNCDDTGICSAECQKQYDDAMDRARREVAANPALWKPHPLSKTDPVGFYKACKDDPGSLGGEA